MVSMGQVPAHPERRRRGWRSGALHAAHSPTLWGAFTAHEPPLGLFPRL